MGSFPLEMATELFGQLIWFVFSKSFCLHSIEVIGAGGDAKGVCLNPVGDVSFSSLRSIEVTGRVCD